MMDTYKSIEKYLPEGASPRRFGNLAAYEIEAGKIVHACSSLHFIHKLPLKIITAFDKRRETGRFQIMYVFSAPEANMFLAPYIYTGGEFPSLTPSMHEASIYERKIHTFFGLRPAGHPNLRTLILHENWPDGIFPLRKDFAWDSRPPKANNEFHFQKIVGDGIYEIPVGPVHAGIIEPGHFRFSVAGEEILHLEPRLGYSHKGSEKLFETLPLTGKIKLSERISGDSSFSHSLCFCQALELLRGTAIPERAAYLRVIFCELERLANHLGDIGAIMADTGFNFGGSQGARLREIVMRINGRVSGSRFLRGVNTPGGVTRDIGNEESSALLNELTSLKKDFSEVIEVANSSSTLLNRLKGTGVLDPGIARDHGVVGVAARALGISADARIDNPYAAYNKFEIRIALEEDGDVNARFNVRVKEVYESIAIISQALAAAPGGSVSATEESAPAPFKADSYALSVVEGWRGDIVYLVSTDSNGNIDRVDVRDPSFLNWTALGYAGRGDMVPDFPLINKSFNLSYSGNDL